MELVSSAALVATAGATILLGARRAHAPAAPGHGGVSASGGEGEPPLTLTARHALLLPLAGSAALLSLFLLFKFVDWALVLYMIALSAGSTYALVQPLAAAACASAAAAAPLCRGRLSPTALSAAAAGVVTLVWAASGHWAANNAIGVAVCVLLTRTLRLPGLRVAAIALVGLLVYDVVWVFYSAAWFGKSVMVEVATQSAANPVSLVAEAIPGLRGGVLPAAFMPAPRLSLPNKFSLPVYVYLPRADAALAAAAGAESGPGSAWLLPASLGGGMLLFAGYTFLGLGDVALPGLLLALAHRVDGAQAAAAAAAGAAGAGAGAAGAGALDEEAGGAEAGGGLLLPPAPASSRAACARAGAAAAGGGGSIGGEGPVKGGAALAAAAPAVGATAVAVVEEERQQLLPTPLTSGGSGAPRNAGRLQLRRGGGTGGSAAAAAQRAVVVAESSSGAGSGAAAAAAAARLGVVGGSDVGGGSGGGGLGGGLGDLAAALWRGLRDTLARPSYLRTGYGGYMAGLLVALTVSRAFHAAQPALLYIVPATLLPLLARAAARRELKLLWVGGEAAGGHAGGDA